MKKHLCILLLLCCTLKSVAWHIVGGELIYDYLGNNNYRVTLKIYRDCNSTTPFDGIPGGLITAWLSVYDVSNQLVGVYDIGAPVITPVPPAFNNPCIQTPHTVCVEEGVYNYTLNLPPQTGGYMLAYQRCCRNSNIVNLVNSDREGSTYFAKIPGPEDAANNNSPRFTKFPPIYICRDVKFKFDHSAVDPDGDQLVYSLCAPYTGLDWCCPSIGMNSPQIDATCVNPPSSCPQAASPPPYTNVLFSSPYSGSYPIASNPAFSINPGTGELTGTPTLVAQYVVGVCIQEYRNNVLINSHFRDFQFTVVGCTVSVTSAIADQKQQCLGNTITFTNQSTNNSSTPIYHWDFGVPNLSNDTSNLFSPTYQYPDTGVYMISLVANPGKPCTDTLKKAVYVYPPLKITYPSQKKQCFTGNSFNFTANGTYIPQTTFMWDFTSSATPSASTNKDPPSVHFTQSGLFFVRLSGKHFACRDSFIDSVRVLMKPLAKINNQQNQVCDPGRIGFSNGSKADLPLKYNWIFSTGKTSFDFEPVQVFTPSGAYQATLGIETTGLCKDTAMTTANINVFPKPKATFSLSPKETSIFEPEIFFASTTSDEIRQYQFNFGDGAISYLSNTQHYYSNYGSYQITHIITNSFGCLDTATDMVKILPEFRFWVPNTFTPDDNSLNDVFMPSTMGISLYKFEIFDGWGERIFHTNNPAEGWNGSFKGEICQQGVYAWKISFRNVASDQNETHLGHVLLMRSP